MIVEFEYNCFTLKNTQLSNSNSASTEECASSDNSVRNQKIQQICIEDEDRQSRSDRMLQ